MDFIMKSTSHGSSDGYSNSSRSDGPPTNVLSDETVRRALAQHAARSSSSNSIPRPPQSPRSKGPEPGCDCKDCRDTSYRDTAGREYTDGSGDRVRESEGDMQLHCHEPPSQPRMERRSTSSSTKSSKKSSSSRQNSYREDKNISTTRDREGNLTKEWSGSEAPGVRTHYDWDANQVDFPEVTALERRGTGRK